MAKYHIYAGYDGLNDLAAQGFRRYASQYYLHLSNIFKYYARFTRISLPAPVKVQPFLSDSEFRKRYKLAGFADTDFVALANNCFEDYSSLEPITRLTTYVLDKMGGFAANDWVLRTDIENK